MFDEQRPVRRPPEGSLTRLGVHHLRGQLFFFQRNKFGNRGTSFAWTLLITWKCLLTRDIRRCSMNKLINDISFFVKSVETWKSVLPIDLGTWDYFIEIIFYFVLFCYILSGLLYIISTFLHEDSHGIEKKAKGILFILTRVVRFIWNIAFSNIYNVGRIEDQNENSIHITGHWIKHVRIMKLVCSFPSDPSKYVLNSHLRL